MSNDTFDDWADAYEAMIDWPRRLANEAGFFQPQLEKIGARSVLDAACGTGHHARMFHSWGLRVEGADVSVAMIEGCRSRWGQAEGLRWTVRGFDQPIDEPGSFDAVVCVGNSLALAGDLGKAAQATARLLEAVRSGGLVIVQVLNVWALPEGLCRWQKCKRATLAGEESLIIKGVHRCGDRGYVDMLVTGLGSAAPTLRSKCSDFLALEAADLDRWAHEGGAREVAIFGNYQGQAYDREKSVDLVLVAQRG